MIFTARQLEELHRGSSNGQVTLPCRARLTPLAQDWIRQRGIKIGYTDTAASGPGSNAAADIRDATRRASAITPSKWMWWADGPCGPAKAALASVARETNLQATEIGVDSKRIVEAIKIIANEIKAGRADGGIMLVSNGAQAMVYANRCPSLRVVLGTCLEAVEQGVRLIAANVLVIEHPYKTLPQAKVLLARFVRGKRELSEEVQRQLAELASCA